MSSWGASPAAALLYLAVGAYAQTAQPRPDAGTLQERPRVIPSLPAPGGPRVEPPARPAPPSAPGRVELTPAGFRFAGNTVFSSDILGRVLATRVGRRTDLAGLQDAAREVREYYQDHGFLLTDALVPEQALAREGGVVTIQVVEARIGQVLVEAGGVPADRFFAIARRALPKGAHASEYVLDLPVLLIRDLAGHDATAAVQPGASPGEVDVVITVRAQPRRLETSLALDNHGVRSAGQARLGVGLETSNLTGIGDTLGVRVQVAQQTDTRLYRVAYSLPLGSAGTRASLSAARSEYALGGAFEALGAHGTADVAGVSLLHPIRRGRTHSTFGTVGFEHKRLDDRLATGPNTLRRISLVRLGIAGNAVREGEGSGALTSYAFGVAHGRLRLDAAAAAVDSAAGGPGAQGGFTKANMELQRTQFFTPRWSATASVQAQWAFDNLTSAEKMTLGGPGGVRAYPSGEAVGDSGVLANAELRYQLIAAQPFPLVVGLFYDRGRVRLVQRPMAAGSNSRTLSGAGLSVLGGTPGRLQAGAALAWRIGSERPSGGEPDRSPRLWLTTQAWF